VLPDFLYLPEEKKRKKDFGRLFLRRRPPFLFWGSMKPAENFPNLPLHLRENKLSTWRFKAFVATHEDDQTINNSGRATTWVLAKSKARRT
jgi:hypothetical protein